MPSPELTMAVPIGEPYIAKATAAEQDRWIEQAIERDQSRLRGFIRRQVADVSDAEDILQDVFYELTVASRLMRPAEQVTAWLFRVARNRIVDLFRRRKAISLNEPEAAGVDGRVLEDLLPSPDAGPDAIYARNLLFDAVDEALGELPANQREVFLAHEIEGRSFKELAEELGVGVNTLLSRKRYAVLHLRKRLNEIKQNYGTE